MLHEFSYFVWRYFTSTQHLHLPPPKQVAHSPATTTTQIWRDGRHHEESSHGQRQTQALKEQQLQQAQHTDAHTTHTKHESKTAPITQRCLHSLTSKTLNLTNLCNLATQQPTQIHNHTTPIQSRCAQQFTQNLPHTIQPTQRCTYPPGSTDSLHCSPPDRTKTPAEMGNQQAPKHQPPTPHNSTSIQQDKNKPHKTPHIDNFNSQSPQHHPYTQPHNTLTTARDTPKRTPHSNTHKTTQ